MDFKFLPYVTVLGLQKQGFVHNEVSVFKAKTDMMLETLHGHGYVGFVFEDPGERCIWVSVQRILTVGVSLLCYLLVHGFLYLLV